MQMVASLPFANAQRTRADALALDPAALPVGAESRRLLRT
jgi:hypothetical protein